MRHERAKVARLLHAWSDVPAGTMGRVLWWNVYRIDVRWETRVTTRGLPRDMVEDVDTVLTPERHDPVSLYKFDPGSAHKKELPDEVDGAPSPGADNWNYEGCEFWLKGRRDLIVRPLDWVAVHADGGVTVHPAPGAAFRDSARDALDGVPTDPAKGVPLADWLKSSPPQEAVYAAIRHRIVLRTLMVGDLYRGMLTQQIAELRGHCATAFGTYHYP